MIGAGCKEAAAGELQILLQILDKTDRFHYIRTHRTAAADAPHL